MANSFREWKKRREQAQSGGSSTPTAHKKGTVVKMDVSDEEKKDKKGKKAEK